MAPGSSSCVRVLKSSAARIERRDLRLFSESESSKVCDPETSMVDVCQLFSMWKRPSGKTATQVVWLGQRLLTKRKRRQQCRKCSNHQERAASNKAHGIHAGPLCHACSSR